MIPRPRPQAARVAVALAIALVTAAGCARREGRTNPAPADTAERDPGSVFTQDVPLRIENRFYGDVVVFLERGGIRTRLATVSGSSTRELRIAARNFEVGGNLQLAAEGIGATQGSNRITIRSGPLIVRPGQRIVWTLASQLQGSNVGIY